MVNKIVLFIISILFNIYLILKYIGKSLIVNTITSRVKIINFWRKKKFKRFILGNLDKDEVFYPQRKSEIEENCYKNAHLNLPVPPGFGLSIGWFTYLIKGYCPRHVNHFNPLDKFFNGHFFVYG